MSNIRKFIRDKQDKKIEHKKLLTLNWKKILVLAIIIVIVLVGVNLFFQHQQFSTYKVTNAINIVNNDDETQYIPYGSGTSFLRYSNDGLSYYKGTKEIWNQAFELKAPIIDQCGDYVAIGERKENTLYLFNKDGLVNKLTTSYPIIDLEVASQGVIVASLEDNGSNYIQILDKNGELLVGEETFLEEGGYPIDISISEDGTKSIVSYLYLDSGNILSKVVFYKFAGEGENESKLLVGGYNFEQTIVPEVKFITNNIACAFGDNKLSIYSMKEKPDLSFESETYTNEIKSVFYNEKYIGLILVNNNSEHPYLMNIYNTSGNKVLSKEFDFSYNDIKFAKNDILLYNDTSCVLYNLSGTKKFEYTFDDNIVYMTGTDKRNTLIVAKANTVEEIKLK